MEESFSSVLKLLASPQGYEPSERLEQLLHFAENAGVVTGALADDICRSLRPYFLHANRGVRAAAIRAWRYCIRTGGDNEILMKAAVNLSFHFFAARSLERGKEFEIERAQVIKLIAKLSHSCPTELPRALVQSLVAVAEHNEDPFRKPCLEVLCELTIRHTELVCQCGGLMTLCRAALDPSIDDMQEPILMTLQYLLGDVATRKFVRSATEIEILLSPFTNTLGNIDDKPEKDEERTKQLGMAKTALILLGRSWSGLLTLMSDDQGGINAVVRALQLESKAVRREILSAFCSLIGITFSHDKPEVIESQVMSISRVATMALGVVSLGTSLDASASRLPPRARPPHDLISNFVATLLYAFLDAGLIEALVEIAREGDADESEQCIRVLAEVLDLANALLPPMVCADLQSLPSLVLRAATFGDKQADHRAKARAILGKLRQFSRRGGGNVEGEESLECRNAIWRPRPALSTGSRTMLERVYALKVRLDMYMDETHYHQQLKASGIVEVKNYRKWNLDMMSEIMEGSLQNPERFKHALSKTKFFKRILSFLRPEKKQFWTLSHTPEHLPFVKMGCQALQTLLANDEGRQYLAASEFVPQIAAMLKTEVDPNPPPTRITAPDNLETTMAREYFVFVGLLSSDEFGIKILSKHRMFDVLLQLVARKSTPDLTRLIYTSLDYSQEGQCRVILRQCLVGATVDVRRHATKHMRVLLRSDVTGFDQWGVNLLTEQLVDPDETVAREALSVLEEACDLSECLDSLIDKKPQIMQLGDAGKRLLLRFLASNKGLTYLNTLGILENEMEEWHQHGCHDYALKIENDLAVAMQGTKSIIKASVPLTTHFFGQLVRTVEGCAVMHKSGHFDYYVDRLQDDHCDSLDLRSALWVIGHVGSCSQGFKTFIEQKELVPIIVELAETSSSVGVRMTSWHVLGLFSMCEEGREAVGRHGWLSPDDPGTAIALPQSMSVFSIPPHTYTSLAAMDWECTSTKQDDGMSSSVSLTTADGDDIKEIMEKVGDLSNHIVADSAVMSLKRMRAKDSLPFSDPALLLRVYDIMSCYKFKLPFRRFIHDLFDGVKW